MKERIAIIGSGISGLVTAYLLARRNDVVLFEANDYLGGHTNTIEVEVGGQRHAVDTGFMVFNRRTYPNFCRLLAQLEIEPQESDMSFSVRSERTGLEWEGGSLNGLFAQRKNLFQPAFYGMLWDVLRFNRLVQAEADRLPDDVRLSDFLAMHRLGREFAENYLAPMIAAIWSAPPSSVGDFPARFLLKFFRNHGLAQIFHRPVWQTIPGGAQRYVAAIADWLGSSVRLNQPIVRVTREFDHVMVEPRGAAAEPFDHVVFATHSDQTLRMLSDPTAAEEAVLDAIPYQRNEVAVHTDTTLLPALRRAWASWNYLVPAATDDRCVVTYDLTRLQRVPTQRPILATLNATHRIRPETILKTLVYHHPVFGPGTLAAQAQWHRINGPRTWFCGAYWGNGFHEDGVNSALAVAQRFGEELEPCTVACTKDESPIAATLP